MTPLIDPQRSWLALEDAAEKEASPRRAALIRKVRDHMEAEINGRIEPLMETLTASPVYHFWGRGEPVVLAGYEAIRGFYTAMFEVGGEQFEVVVERVVATDDCVVTEGQVKQVHKGDALISQGVKEASGEAIDADRLYLSDAQLVTVWPADAEGLLIGEDIYFGVDPLSTLKPIAKSQLPEGFVI